MPLEWGDRPPGTEDHRNSRVFCLSDAISSDSYKPASPLTNIFAADDYERDRERVENISNQAPNLTLGSESHPFPARCLAMIGILLQTGVIWSTGIVTLYSKEYKSNRLFSPELGSYVFTSGVVLIVLGLVISCYIIQCSSEEIHFVPRNMSRYGALQEENAFKVITIQKASILGDELFGSYAIDPKTDVVRTSRLKPDTKMEKYRLQVLLVSASTVSGFILQFVGLLSLHWSASVILLGTSIFMLGVRVLACQRLASPLSITKIPEDHELAYLTMNEIVGLERWEIKCGRMLLNDATESSAAFDATLDEETPKIAINVRIKAERLVSERSENFGNGAADPLSLPAPWPKENVPLVDQLFRAISSIYKEIIDSEDIEFKGSQEQVKRRFSWWNAVLMKTLPKDNLETRVCQGRLKLTLKHGVGSISSKDPEVDKEELSAILSLWRYSLLPNQAPQAVYNRILGSCRNESELLSTNKTAKRWNIWPYLWFGGSYLLLGYGMSLKAQDQASLGYPIFGLSLASQGSNISTTGANAGNIAERIVFGIGKAVFLDEALAQEIFLNFLVALTEEIKTVHGYTHRYGDKWQNTVLVSLMATLRDSGLVGDIYDAAYLIISSFMKHGLLPTSLAPPPGWDEGGTSGDDDSINRAK